MNRGFTSHIVGRRPDESRSILDLLYRYLATLPRLRCRVEWEPNTPTFWDNRCTRHRAVWDDHPHSRQSERVSILADERPGR